MFATKIIMPGKQASVKDLCYMLWTECFDDTKQYTDYYFNNRWNNSITVIADGVSMLHLNPYNTIINGKETEIYNIAGVCTLKEYRKRGYMDSVLKSAINFMYSQGKPFTYLMPASEEIYKPYGFTNIYPVRKFKGGIKLPGSTGSKLICIPYNMLKDSQKADLTRYAQNRLAERFTCYTVHNKSYFQAFYEEMQVCNGNILAFWNEDGVCQGYFVYLCEEMPEVIESVFEKDIQKDIQNEILAYLARFGYPAIKINETNFWNLDLQEQKMEKPKNYLMARIIDLKAFAECISVKGHKEMWLEVTDNIISGNNGRWHIITGEGETYCQKCRENGKHYIKCTIEELGQKCLGGMEYFLNELV